MSTNDSLTPDELDQKIFNFFSLFDNFANSSIKKKIEKIKKMEQKIRFIAFATIVDSFKKTHSEQIIKITENVEKWPSIKESKGITEADKLLADLFNDLIREYNKTLEEKKKIMISTKTPIETWNASSHYNTAIIVEADPEMLKKAPKEEDYESLKQLKQAKEYFIMDCFKIIHKYLNDEISTFVVTLLEQSDEVKSKMLRYVHLFLMNFSLTTEKIH